MRISSTTNTAHVLFQNSQKTSPQKSDGISEGIRKQIENIKGQISDLSKNEALSPKDKMDKRKELQDLLQDLNNQLSQRQIEIKKEALEKNTDQSENVIDRKKTNLSTKEKSDTVSISDTAMNSIAMKSLINSEFTMTQINITNGVKTKLEGQGGVLIGEIKLDRSRGVDTSAKSAKLSDIKGNINSISMDTAADLAKINQHVKDDAGSKETGNVDPAKNNAKYEDKLDKDKDSDTNALLDPNNPSEAFITYDPVDVRF
nr:FlxA-like family protein [uncultured Acetobacterium sp.]